MSEKFYRATYLNVNLDAILANYQNFNQLHANKTVISVIENSTTFNASWCNIFCGGYT